MSITISSQKTHKGAPQNSESRILLGQSYLSSETNLQMYFSEALRLIVRGGGVSAPSALTVANVKTLTH